MDKPRVSSSKPFTWKSTATEKGGFRVRDLYTAMEAENGGMECPVTWPESAECSSPKDETMRKKTRHEWRVSHNTLTDLLFPAEPHV